MNLIVLVAGFVFSSVAVDIIEVATGVVYFDVIATALLASVTVGTVGGTEDVPNVDKDRDGVVIRAELVIAEVSLCKVVVAEVVVGTVASVAAAVAVEAKSVGKLGKFNPVSSTFATAASTAAVDPCISTMMEPARTSTHSTLPLVESESVHSCKNLALSEPTTWS